MKTLQSMAADGAGAAQVADAAVAIWVAIDTALAPVIGPRGSTALFKRSLHLTRAHYPLLAGTYDAAGSSGDYSNLRAVLSQQSPTDAAAAHDSMLRTFHDLLAELIGRSLTQRLLHAAWEPPSSAAGEQDTPQ